MKAIKLTILLFLILKSFISHSQIKFQKGTIVENNGNRTECIIKNQDWAVSPMQIEYKLSENSEVIIGTLSTIKEFEIFGQSHYIKARVNIDASNPSLNQMSIQRNPEWVMKEAFLEVLVDGKAKLYKYSNHKVERYLFQNTDSIKQLIWKEYRLDNYTTSYNEGFKQQLFNEVNCGALPIGYFNNFNFNKNTLVRYFEKYNECVEGVKKNIAVKEKRDFFNLKIAPGIVANFVSTENSEAFFSLEFERKINYRIGAELEYIMPFHKNKWGLVFEPTYQDLELFKSFTPNSNSATINYKSIDFPLGIRHYLFLNQSAKLFLNGFYLTSYSANFNSKIDFEKFSDIKIKTRGSFAIGGGITFKRLSAEFRYYTNRDLTNNYIFWSTGYKRASIILGYRIF